LGQAQPIRLSLPFALRPGSNNAIPIHRSLRRESLAPHTLSCLLLVSGPSPLVGVFLRSFLALGFVRLFHVETFHLVFFFWLCFSFFFWFSVFFFLS
jgi:hypothetical protein